MPGEGIDHAWNAVFISGSWRLLDCTWGAGKTDALGHHFKKQLDEHFFLTDPDELIYTHFPFDEVRVVNLVLILYEQIFYHLIYAGVSVVNFFNIL